MQSAVLPDSSCAMTSEGWVTICSLTECAKVVGIDRRGRVATASIDVAAGGIAPSAVFVTSMTMAVLGSACRVIGRDGTTPPIADLINACVASSVWCECVSAHEVLVPGEAAFDRFWHALSCAAPFQASGRLGRRCRQVSDDADGPRAATLRKRGGVTIVTQDRVRFIVCERDQLQKAFLNEWASTVVGVVHACARDPDTGTPVFGVDDHALLLWYVLALARLEEPWKLSCDSLQHTTYCHVGDGTSSEPIRIAQGLCACTSSLPVQHRIIKWSEPGWSPVVGGLILGSNGAGS